MHSHCINKLLNLEDVIVKKVSHSDSFVKIFDYVLSANPSFINTYNQTVPTAGGRHLRKTQHIHHPLH